MEKIIEFLSKLSLKDIPVLLTIVSALVSTIVGGILYVEHTYAKLVQVSIQQTQIIQQQKQILSIVNALPENVRDEIIKRANAEKALVELNQTNYVGEKK